MEVNAKFSNLEEACEAFYEAVPAGGELSERMMSFHAFFRIEMTRLERASGISRERLKQWEDGDKPTDSSRIRLENGIVKVLSGGAPEDMGLRLPKPLARRLAHWVATGKKKRSIARIRLPEGHDTFMMPSPEFQCTNLAWLESCFVFDRLEQSKSLPHLAQAFCGWMWPPIENLPEAAWVSVTPEDTQDGLPYLKGYLQARQNCLRIARDCEKQFQVILEDHQRQVNSSAQPPAPILRSLHRQLDPKRTAQRHLHWFYSLAESPVEKLGLLVGFVETMHALTQKYQGVPAIDWFSWLQDLSRKKQEAAPL